MSAVDDESTAPVAEAACRIKPAEYSERIRALSVLGVLPILLLRADGRVRVNVLEKIGHLNQPPLPELEIDRPAINSDPKITRNVNVVPRKLLPHFLHQFHSPAVRQSFNRFFDRFSCDNRIITAALFFFSFVVVVIIIIVVNIIGRLGILLNPMKDHPKDALLVTPPIGLHQNAEVPHEPRNPNRWRTVPVRLNAFAHRVPILDTKHVDHFPSQCLLVAGLTLKLKRGQADALPALQSSRNDPHANFGTISHHNEAKVGKDRATLLETDSVLPDRFSEHPLPVLGPTLGGRVGLEDAFHRFDRSVRIVGYYYAGD
mmetsp:Transcript_25625/g.57058  ORF Transcript_25625/g.57058 Transcript_25625/m.57058 type:complete len:316 (-) Transcript_25625:222-1169(-)